jgi:hypothetical protein
MGPVGKPEELLGGEVKSSNGNGAFASFCETFVEAVVSLTAIGFGAARLGAGL